MALVYGKPVAERILKATKERIAVAKITPGLGVILVGDDAASHLYVGLKERAATECGIMVVKKLFPETVSFQELVTCIEELNGRADIHGILVQLPLPEGLPTDEIIAHITPTKDTDGFHQETIRQFLLGREEACPVFPRAVVELLRETKELFHGEKALVIANSDLLGKVMSHALTYEGLVSEYVLSSEKKGMLLEKARRARVIVTACGIPNMVTSDMMSDHVTVIDGGVSHRAGKVVGDVAKSVAEKASFLAPMPGGVGPVTVATLLSRVTDVALSLTKRG